MPKQGINRNVWLTNYFTLADGLAMGMWNYAILGPYLFKLCGDNKHAGYAEGVQGTFQALASIPAGIFADRYRRDTVLKWSGVIGILGVILTLVGLAQPAETTWENYIILTVGLGVFGAYMGMWSPPLYAIYADSVASGQRSAYETWRYVMSIASLASGPVTNIILFYFLGDNWGMHQMTVVFMVGMVLHFLSLGALFFFNDDDALGEESAALIPGAEEEEDEDAVVQRRLAEAENMRLECCSWLHVSMVPWIVACSDCCFGLASGMTIKFFPIYFAEELHLSPIAVNIIFILDPVVEVFMSLIGQRLSLKFGRVEIMLVFKAFGITLLWLMAGLPAYWKEHAYLLALVYIVRSALINCVVPLSRSILMDYVRPDGRAKWNAVESIAAFGWSGSAVVGGLLVDNYGFGVSFGFTAFIQMMAWFPLTLLLPLVVREERAEARRKSSEMADPLLPGMDASKRRYSQ